MKDNQFAIRMTHDPKVVEFEANLGAREDALAHIPRLLNALNLQISSHYWHETREGRIFSAKLMDKAGRHLETEVLVNLLEGARSVQSSNSSLAAAA